MKTRDFAAALAAFIVPLFLLQPAQARKLHPRSAAQAVTYSTVPNAKGEYLPIGQQAIRTDISRLSRSGCPRNLGCGCNLANYFHIVGKQWRKLWVARNWENVGAPAVKGCTGCVAVMSRGRGGHVGVVKSYDANGNPVVYSYANGRLGWTTTTYSAGRVIAYRSL